MRRLLTTVIIVVTLGAALTGCSRFGNHDPASDAPSSPVSTPSSGSSDDGSVDDLLDDLDDADDAATQADADGLAGDDAARTDDAP